MARKVLLADDSVTAQNMGRRILIDAGYEVITVNNGSSAIKKVNECKPDLIVLDVYMPGYGGLEVCQRIRESQETSRIPVLLTVGKLEPFKAEEARRVRADAFIVKPFEASELLTALTKLEDKIVPSRKRSKNFADEEPGVSREFGDLDSGWKNRLKIPPPHHPHSQPPAVTEERAPEPVSSDSATSQAQISSSQEQAGSFKVEVPEPLPSEPVPAPAPEFSVSPESDKVAEPSPEKVISSEVAELVPESTTKAAGPEESAAEPHRSHEEDVAAALAVLAPVGGHDSQSSQAAEAVPVTMAMAGEYSGPRWVAQEVTLGDDESAMILEQEMHKAFAAFAAADAARMAISLPPQSQQPAEVKVSAIATSGETETPMDEAVPVSAPKEGQPFEAPAPATVEGQAEPENDTAPDSSEPAGAAFAAAASAGSGESLNAISSTPVASEIVPATESKHDSELAAAWASWKQVRETVSTPDFTAQVSEPEEAGYRDVQREGGSDKAEAENAGGEESAAIAGIVDSVLAELKPKLMEEISKKMKKPKK